MGNPAGAVYFMGLLAVIAAGGLFVDWRDGGKTRMVLAFLDSILWALFGILSFDVYVDDAASVSEPIYPLAYLGLGLAMIAGMFALKEILHVIKSEAVPEQDQGRSGLL